MWFWTMLVIDVMLLIPAFYMATSAAGIATTEATTMTALGVLALYLVLPVFCIAAPYSAWRAHLRSDDANAAAIAAMPVIYAVFLTLVIFWQ
jgi:hypothetical protein